MNTNINNTLQTSNTNPTFTPFMLFQQIRNTSRFAKAYLHTGGGVCLQKETKHHHGRIGEPYPLLFPHIPQTTNSLRSHKLHHRIPSIHRRSAQPPSVTLYLLLHRPFWPDCSYLAVEMKLYLTYICPACPIGCPVGLPGRRPPWKILASRLKEIRSRKAHYVDCSAY